MGTGEETKGREAIGQMLHYMYHVAFDAKADVHNTIITEQSALMESISRFFWNVGYEVFWVSRCWGKKNIEEQSRNIQLKC